MSQQPESEEPFLQRLLEQPFLLLGIGMAVMFVFYTGWGALELYYLPQAALP
jgi:hypothetical protein